eukprot:747690-Hanusia_phi.AAC.1
MLPSPRLSHPLSARSPPPFPSSSLLFSLTVHPRSLRPSSIRPSASSCLTPSPSPGRAMASGSRGVTSFGRGTSSRANLFADSRGRDGLFVWGNEVDDRRYETEYRAQLAAELSRLHKELEEDQSIEVLEEKIKDQFHELNRGASLLRSNSSLLQSSSSFARSNSEEAEKLEAQLASEVSDLQDMTKKHYEKTHGCFQLLTTKLKNLGKNLVHQHKFSNVNVKDSRKMVVRPGKPPPPPFSSSSPSSPPVVLNSSLFPSRLNFLVPSSCRLRPSSHTPIRAFRRLGHLLQERLEDRAREEADQRQKGSGG